MENTCVNFQENGPGVKLVYLPRSGCSSFTGDRRFMFPDGQEQSLKGDCVNLGSVQHETMHALGFAHTQARSDRDDYLFVDEKNIQLNYTKNFIKESSSNYGVPYEYGSRMHYDAFMYNIDPKPVLIPHNKIFLGTLGSSPYLTFYDWKLINSRYNCSESCTNKIVCENGGYQHPRNCDKCFCTDYYTGVQCEKEKKLVELQQGGEQNISFVREATRGPSEGTFLFPDYEKDEHVIIKAPKDMKVRVTVSSLSYDMGGWDFGGKCRLTCDDIGVELRDGDLALTGLRLCCWDDANYSFVSKTNTVGYFAYSAPYFSIKFVVTFSAVPSPSTSGTTTVSTKPTEIVTTTVSTTTTEPITTTVPPKPTDPVTTTVPTVATVGPIATTSSVEDINYCEI